LIFHRYWQKYWQKFWLDYRLQAAIATILFFQLSCSSTAPNLERDFSTFKGVNVTLADLAQNPRKSGLDFETSTNREQLLALANRYVQSKSKQKPGSADDFMQECLNGLQEDARESDPLDQSLIAATDAEISDGTASFSDAPGTPDASDTPNSEDERNEKSVFCQSLQKSAQNAVKRGSTRNRERAALREKLKKDIALIRHALVRGEIEKIQMMPEVEVSSAIRQLKDTRVWAKAMQNTLQSPCVNAAIPTAMGLRTEEEFPNDQAVGNALGLYAKAVECGVNVSSVKAAYRLGLLHVWKEQWEDAQALFSKMVDEPLAADFRMRLLFWQAQVARVIKGYQEGDRNDPGENARIKLAQEFPLSLHTLLLEGPKKLITKLNSLPRDSEVKFRSFTRPELNDIVRTVEALQVVAPDKERLASELLAQANGKIEEAEPEFQLYFGVLLHRSHDTIRKFQLLSGLIKKNKNLLSRASLELLYPLPILEAVKGQANVADPYLVLALIRQESAFNERARSRVGAVGLMQVMPRTARLVDRKMTVQKLYQPENNLRVGIRYFNGLSSRYEGDVELALAAYNAGPHRVDRWKERYPTQNRILFLDLIPFKETRDYVSSIARNYYWYANLYSEAMNAPTPDRNLASFSGNVEKASSVKGPALALENSNSENENRGVGGRGPNSSKLSTKLRVFDQLMGGL